MHSMWIKILQTCHHAKVCIQCLRIIIIGRRRAYLTMPSTFFLFPLQWGANSECCGNDKYIWRADKEIYILASYLWTISVSFKHFPYYTYYIIWHCAKCFNTRQTRQQEWAISKKKKPKLFCLPTISSAFLVVAFSKVQLYSEEIYRAV